jgi:outer membrane lipoprotein-sorting protein
MTPSPRKKRMKKILYFIALIIFGTSVKVTAQSETRAKTILADVSKKYRSYDVIRTEFNFTVYNPQAKLNETQSGTLYVRSKANKYKVILKDQELISDGKNQWTFLKEDKEVQLSEVNNESGAFNPAKIFTIYEKGFKALYTNDSKADGKIYHNIELAPLDAKSSFFKIKLKIDKTAKQIVSAVIYDKNGSHYTYSIKSFTPNVKVPESTFAFDPKKFPGVEVVDLR